jgi:hypothetical protein
MVISGGMVHSIGTTDWRVSCSEIEERAGSVLRRSSGSRRWLLIVM